MSCTGTEEECRRRCIINPSQCGIGNAPTNQISALAEELRLAAGHEDDGELNFHRLAKHLLTHFVFAATPVPSLGLTPGPDEAG